MSFHSTCGSPLARSLLGPLPTRGPVHTSCQHHTLSRGCYRTIRRPKFIGIRNGSGIGAVAGSGDNPLRLVSYRRTVRKQLTDLRNGSLAGRNGQTDAESKLADSNSAGPYVSGNGYSLQHCSSSALDSPSNNTSIQVPWDNAADAVVHPATAAALVQHGAPSVHLAHEAPQSTVASHQPLYAGASCQSDFAPADTIAALPHGGLDKEDSLAGGLREGQLEVDDGSRTSVSGTAAQRCDPQDKEDTDGTGPAPAEGEAPRDGIWPQVPPSRPHRRSCTAEEFLHQYDAVLLEQQQLKARRRRRTKRKSAAVGGADAAAAAAAGTTAVALPAAESGTTTVSESSVQSQPAPDVPESVADSHPQVFASCTPPPGEQEDLRSATGLAALVDSEPQPGPSTQVLVVPEPPPEGSSPALLGLDLQPEGSVPAQAEKLGASAASPPHPDSHHHGHHYHCQQWHGSGHLGLGDRRHDEGGDRADGGASLSGARSKRGSAGSGGIRSGVLKSVARFSDYETAEARGLHGEDLRRTLRGAEVEQQMRAAVEKRRRAGALGADADADDEDAVGLHWGLPVQHTGSDLGRPYTAEEKADFWWHICEGDEEEEPGFGGRSYAAYYRRNIPVLIAVRQPEPYGAAEVYELPGLGVGPMDEPTWTAWGQQPGSNRPQQPLVVLTEEEGWGFELCPAEMRGEGGWRCYEVQLGRGYSHDETQTLFPHVVVCGERVAANLRGLRDLLEFLADPGRETVAAHLTFLALMEARGRGCGQGRDQRRETRRAGSDGAAAEEAGRESKGKEEEGQWEPRYYAPDWCHHYLRRRWGAEALVELEWGPRDTLLYLREVRRDHDEAYRRWGEWQDAGEAAWSVARMT